MATRKTSRYTITIMFETAKPIASAEMDQLQKAASDFGSQWIKKLKATKGVSEVSEFTHIAQ